MRQAYTSLEIAHFLEFSESLFKTPFLSGTVIYVILDHKSGSSQRNAPRVFHTYVSALQWSLVCSFITLLTEWHSPWTCKNLWNGFQSLTSQHSIREHAPQASPWACSCLLLESHIVFSELMLLSLFSFCFSENPFHLKAANFTLCWINLHFGRQYLYSKQYIVKITHF